MEKQQKNIVILGGGYAGVLTAKKLEKKIKKAKLKDQVKITLIDKNPYNTMLTELHEVAANRVDEASIKMNFDQIFAKRNVDVVIDEITKMDFENNKLIGNEKDYEYDYLVVGTGSRPAYFGTDGAKDNSFSLWSFDDAIRLREHILQMFRLAERTYDKEEREKLLTFYIVGGGFTGVEMAGELADWLPRLCLDYHIDKKDVKIVLVDMMDRILMPLPEKTAQKANNYMANKLGIKVETNTKVLKVQSDSITTSLYEVEKSNPTYTVVWAAGIEGSNVIKECDLGCEASRKNRLETNEYLQFLQYDNVYVAGDNLYVIPEGEERAVPQMVENAEHSANSVAKNLMVDLKGEGKKQAYKPKFHGAMVSIGGRYGVCNVGMPNRYFSMPSFLAMFAKHFINVIYFVQVMGWTKVWSYLKHEIFGIRDNRAFTGGHFSNNQPTFWSLPLRLFLGTMWLTEGLVKLEKIMAAPMNVFLFTIPAEKLPDGVSSASVAMEAKHFWIPEIFHTIDKYALTSEMTLPIPQMLQPMVDWSMDMVIIPIAPYFQMFIVGSEVLIGLLLILGLFTSFTALYSAALCFMIYMSGSSNKEILWFVFGGLSLVSLGGTGQAFSSDYYILPRLKEMWRKIPFIRKWYLYNE